MQYQAPTEALEAKRANFLLLEYEAARYLQVQPGTASFSHQS